MLERFLPTANQIPFDSLPLAFQQRLAKLAYVPDLKNLRKTCPEIKHLCRDGATDLAKVYFTDDATHFQRASAYLRYFRWFEQVYKWLWIDNIFSFYPIWLNVWNLQQVEQNKTKLYVTDTLVLNCVDSDSYDKFIPYIGGPYTRISIRGHVRLDQIFAQVEFNEDEYAEFAKLINQQLRGFQHKFMFRFDITYVGTSLIPEITKTVKYGFLNSLVTVGSNCYFFDKRFLLLKMLYYLLILLFYYCVFLPTLMDLTGPVVTLIIIIFLPIVVCGTAGLLSEISNSASFE